MKKGAVSQAGWLKEAAPLYRKNLYQQGQTSLRTFSMTFLQRSAATQRVTTSEMRGENQTISSRPKLLSTQAAATWITPGA